MFCLTFKGSRMIPLKRKPTIEVRSENKTSSSVFSYFEISCRLANKIIRFMEVVFGVSISTTYRHRGRKQSLLSFWIEYTSEIQCHSVM